MTVLNGVDGANQCEISNLGLVLNNCKASSPANTLINYPGVTFPDSFSMGLWVSCQAPGTILEKAGLFRIDCVEDVVLGTGETFIAQPHVPQVIFGDGTHKSLNTADDDLTWDILDISVSFSDPNHLVQVRINVNSENFSLSYQGNENYGFVFDDAPITFSSETNSNVGYLYWFWVDFSEESSDSNIMSHMLVPADASTFTREFSQEWSLDQYFDVVTNSCGFCLCGTDKPCWGDPDQCTFCQCISSIDYWDDAGACLTLDEICAPITADTASNSWILNSPDLRYDFFDDRQQIIRNTGTLDYGHLINGESHLDTVSDCIVTPRGAYLDGICQMEATPNLLVDFAEPIDYSISDSTIVIWFLFKEIATNGNLHVISYNCETTGNCDMRIYIENHTLTFEIHGLTVNVLVNMQKWTFGHFDIVASTPEVTILPIYDVRRRVLSSIKSSEEQNSRKLQGGGKLLIGGPGPDNNTDTHGLFIYQIQISLQKALQGIIQRDFVETCHWYGESTYCFAGSGGHCMPRCSITQIYDTVNDQCVDCNCVVDSWCYEEGSCEDECPGNGGVDACSSILDRGQFLLDACSPYSVDTTTLTCTQAPTSPTCSAYCAQCQSDNTCEICSDSNATATDGVNWQCIDGWYANTNAGSCSICPNLCATWTQYNNCSSCNPGVAGPTNGQCSCPAQTYESGSAWQSCPYGCISCVTTPWDGCFGEMVHNVDKGICELECPSGYSEYEYNCQRWTANCLEWNNFPSCDTCVDGMSLIGGACTSCLLPCTTCSGSINNCTAWTGILELSENGSCGCVDSTQILDTTNWTCYTPITIELVQIDANNFQLTLSQPIAKTLTEDDINIEIVDYFDNSYIALFSLTSLSTVQFLIVITPLVQVPVNSKVTLKLSSDLLTQSRLQTDAVTTTTSDAIQPESSSDSSNDDSDLEKQEEVDDDTSTSSVAFLSVTGAITIATQNGVSLWRVINTMQLLSLLVFLNVDSSPTLKGFLHGLLKDTRIPNLYDFLRDYDTSSMPGRFSTSRYSHPSFFDIFGHLLTIWLIIAVLVGLAMLTLKVKNPKIRKIGEVAKSKMIYNGIIRLLMTSFIYIMFGFSLNLRYGVNDSAISILNTTVSILAFIGICIFWYTILILTHKYEHVMDDEAYRITYGEISKEMKTEIAFYKKIYTFLFLLRRACLVLCLTLLSEVPELQLGAVSLVNFLYILWIIKARPFESRILNFIEIFIDSVVLLVTLSFSLFLVSPSSSKDLGEFIIALCVIAILVSAVMVFVTLVKKIREWYKNRKAQNIAPVLEVDKTIKIDANQTVIDTEAVDSTSIMARNNEVMPISNTNFMADDNSHAKYLKPRQGKFSQSKNKSLKEN